MRKRRVTVCPVPEGKPKLSTWCEHGHFAGVTVKSFPGSAFVFNRCYCETDGLDSPTGACAAGWYCNGSASAAQETVFGGECEAGTYCPTGSYRPTECDPGMYCETNGVPMPTGNCTAGEQHHLHPLRNG